MPYWPKAYLLCSVFLEDGDVGVKDASEIPLSEIAQHADNRLDAVQEILLDPLVPTDFLESGVRSLV